MYYILGTIWGVAITLYGLILLTRRKLMIRRVYDFLFLFFITMSNTTIELIKMGYWIWPLLITALLFILAIIITRDRFTLTNVNSQMVSSVLTDILKEKNISYKQDENNITLKDYDNKRISYTQSLNSVEINFKDIRSFDFYKELKEELRCRIKKLKLEIFPSTGLFYTVLGVIVIIVLQYLQKVSF